MRGISVCLVLAGLSQATVQVYLHPSPALPATALSPNHASFALSRHLGLDFFESTEGGVHEIFLNDQSFVGQGSRSGLLLSIPEEDARDVIPPSLKQSFSLSDSPSVSSLSTLITTYLNRARHVYTAIHFSELAQSVRDGHSRDLPFKFIDLFSVSSSATETFLIEMSALSAFLDTDELSTDKFAAFELKGLSEIAETYGRSSEQYRVAARTVEAAIESALAKTNMNVALLSFTPSTTTSLGKRQNDNDVGVQPPQQSPLPAPSPMPQQPIAGISTCFPSADVCANSTNSCSGRGECLSATKAGKTCFICACSQTKSNGKTQTWVGDACERKDISGPFVLIAGSTIGLILLIGASISLLAAIGGDELPSTLTGGAVNAKKE